ncbi:MAG: DUF4126 domain-containing protein [Acidobacteriota bacterium]|nr:DUF4126 domain-containing protein [Acidobacteriota bacterium]
MANVFGVLVGVGLSAVCGFRVFVPLLGVSAAALSGYLPLSPGMAWLGSWQALIAFAVATVLEIAAYYIPVVDSVMDTLATPSAVVAGAIVTAAMVGDVSPFLKWSLAIIAGGGAAGAVQTSTVALRAAGQAAAPVVATPVMTTLETAGSALVTVLSFVAPVLGVLVVAVIGLMLFLLVKRFVRGVRSLARRKAPAAPVP